MGYTAHARRERWQLFATLTFLSPVPGEGARLRMLFAWLRTVAKTGGISFPGLLWIARAEQGEVGSRHHFHVLITGLGPCGVTPAFPFVTMAAWERLGGGMARVYRYETGLSAVDYLMKGLEQLDTSAEGAQAYEFNKFAGVEATSLGLIPGHTLLRKWGVVADRNRGLRRAHETKARQCDRSTRRSRQPMGKPARFPHPADLAGRAFVR
jgi:hypothetical protein